MCIRLTKPDLGVDDLEDVHLGIYSKACIDGIDEDTCIMKIYRKGGRTYNLFKYALKRCINKGAQNRDKNCSGNYRN